VLRVLRLTIMIAGIVTGIVVDIVDVAEQVMRSRALGSEEKGRRAQ